MTLTKFMARSTWVAHAFEWEKLLKCHLKGKASKKILIILKKENGPRASSAPALEFNTIIFKHVYCPPPFRRKAEGHSFWLSVLPSVLPSVRPSFRPSFRPPIGVCTLCAQLLLQFYSNSFETLQMSSSCFEDVHVVWI